MSGFTWINGFRVCNKCKLTQGDPRVDTCGLNPHNNTGCLGQILEGRRRRRRANRRHRAYRKEVRRG